MLLTIKQHYADIRLPTWQPGTSSTAIAGLSIVLDLLVAGVVVFQFVEPALFDMPKLAALLRER